ncbi:uncharacterized protein LOC122387305 [Amphibalanus amphitrite]|uniref:uncharacterized protein LOC122387305 n=1 Tax=Amphibalanus amphitrite TaxID=1232801 RepID=UPI001C91F353|nr:uncharacterized protein LOC122387305 [Amphibalanus amphitrite]
MSSTLPSVSLVFRTLLAMLLLQTNCLAQMVIARGYQPFGVPDSVASGPVLETVLVRSSGECASRALLYNSLGFNLQRTADASGQRSCQPTNTVPGCHSVNLEQRTGWDYYLTGRSGQNEAVTARTDGYTINTYVSDWSSYPALLATDDPHRRWGVDCNRPATQSPDRECSRYILTGIDDGDYRFDDLDYARCFTYGTELRVSEQLATKLPVEITPDQPAQECPPNHVVTALSDDNSYFGNVDWMKCALLLANWRVNYDDCMFTDPSTIGGSTTAWGGSWNTGTPQDLVYGVVGLWRTGYIYTGFKQCRLYRVA